MQIPCCRAITASLSASADGEVTTGCDNIAMMLHFDICSAACTLSCKLTVLHNYVTHNCDGPGGAANQLPASRARADDCDISADGVAAQIQITIRSETCRIECKVEVVLP